MVAPVSFLLVLSLLVFVHELGHFLAARMAGVPVIEFGFGYPPRMVKLAQWGETAITLNWLPIGGFVRMNENDPTVPESLANRSRRVRVFVLSAGAVMNVVLAVVLYSTTFLLGALTPYQGPGAGVYGVSEHSPAYLAGIRPGDTILSIDGETIESVDDAVAMIRVKLGEPIELTIRRNDKLLPPITVTPREEPPPEEGALGVSLNLPLRVESYPLWRAVPLGVRTTYLLARSMFTGIGAAIRGETPFQISGPVGIYQTTAEVAKTGLLRLLEFTGFLSLNLFLVNLLPLPALDGGRVIFVLLEWIRGGRRIAPEKEGLVHAMGMVFLLAFMIVVTYLDYLRYFASP